MPQENVSGAVKRRHIKNLLINPRYQFKYILWVSVTGLFLVALNASVFYGYVRENYTILVDLSPMDDAAKIQLYRELNEIVAKLAGVSLLFLLGVTVLGVILSHRTAGPLYHFKRVFNAVRGGDLKARIHLRPGDDFQDVAESFNGMMDRLTSASKG